MNSRWNLETRVAGILDPRRNPASRAGKWKLIAVAVTLILTSAAVAGVRWEQPQSPDKGRAAAIVPETRGAASIEPHATRWRIPGIVVDEAGKPVGGATVRILSGDWPVEYQTTGPDGSFVIQANDPIQRKCRLIATSDEGRRQGMSWFLESSNSQIPAVPARIVLKPSRIVTATVVDQGGKPIGGEAVEVIGEGGSVAIGKSDAAGRASLHYPGGINVKWIIALKSGAGFDYYENYDSWPANDGPTVPGSVTLVLNGAETVHVKAIDPQGRPVPGLVFRPSSLNKRSKLSRTELAGSRVASARADRDGDAVFAWLPQTAGPTYGSIWPRVSIAPWIGRRNSGPKNSPKSRSPSSTGPCCVAKWSSWTASRLSESWSRRKASPLSRRPTAQTHAARRGPRLTERIK